jgi:hypothetical protein
MPLTPSVINKLTLARHLFLMALDNLRSHRETALFAAVNLMQDAVEAFLLAVAEQVKAVVDSGTGFEKYFAKIDERIAPKELPFRQRLVALNKVRVNAKHHGVKPDRNEARAFAVVCREFFDESSASILGMPFWSISLVDLLEDEEIRDLLVGAQSAFDKGAYWECLVECRKVIFLRFEWHYDISEFKDEAAAANFFAAAFCHAPAYAKDKRYIDENVRNPFDYIVLDHSRLDGELVKEGLDPGVFWNIWRLRG